MTHLTEHWASLQRTAGPQVRTWWHVTDNPKFAIDGGYQSMTGENEWGESSRREHGGLFITPNPELWLYLWRYSPGQRMYAAEIKPAATPRMLGLVGGGDDRDQAMLNETEARQATVVRVVPVEEAIKQARRDGFGFALLMHDAYAKRLVHVIDHRKGYGSTDSLCGGWGGGEPLKWTTKDWVLHHASSRLGDALCAECLAKLRRQRT